LVQCSIVSMVRLNPDSRSTRQCALPDARRDSDAATMMQPAALHQSGDVLEKSAADVNW